MGVTDEMRMTGTNSPAEAAKTIHRLEVERQWKENMTKQKAEHGDVAVKFDGDKLRMELLPVRPIEDIASVLTIGAKKYADRNWEKGFDYSRTYGALQRHMHAWYKGEDNDPETGLSHLAHAGCCLMFLLEFTHSGAGTDDRVKYVDKSE